MRSIPSHRPRFLAPVLLGSLFAWVLPQIATAALPTSTNHWDRCVTRHAQELQIDPALLHAIIWTESKNQPLAIAWTDRWGKRHSVFPKTTEDARALMTQLQRSQQTFDLGLAQVNSKNIARLAKPLDVQPTDLLQPCTNLKVASYVLREQLDRHGYTWRAIAGYNGSLPYINLVWQNLCQRHTTTLCHTDGLALRSNRIPAPTDSIRATTLPIADGPIVTTLINAPASLPPVIQETPVHVSFSAPVRTIPPNTDPPDNTTTWLDRIPTASRILTISVRLLASFSLLIGTIILFCYGIRIIFWALGLVRESLIALLRGHRTTFPHPLQRPLTS